MNCTRKLFLASLLATCAISWNRPALSQDCQPGYRVTTQHIWVPEEVTRYRLEYETVVEDQEVVSYKPVWTTRYEEKKVTVAKPVVETSNQQETYTVLRPVTRTEEVEETYYETTYVDETSNREETVISYKPVTETRYQTRQYTVQRPVTETQMQTQQYTVQRPVTETHMQQQNYVTYQPVTTYQPAVVDQGGYVAQQYVQPGDTTYRLRWVPGGTATTGTGQPFYRWGGLGWVPYQSAPQTFTQMQYQPNYQQVAIPQTSMMPQVVQQQVPVQVTKIQNEVVTQQVPVQVTRMETEVVSQQEPYQINRWEQVQEKRSVPVTVRKPVTQRMVRKVPVTRTEWVEQKMVRPYTVQRTRIEYETVVKKEPVQVYSTERVVSKVKVQRQVPRWVEFKEVRQVLRPVTTSVPLTWYDPYSAAIVTGYSSFGTIVSGEPTPAKSQTAEKPEVKEGAAEAAKTETPAATPEDKKEDTGSGIGPIRTDAEPVPAKENTLPEKSLELNDAAPAEKKASEDKST